MSQGQNATGTRHRRPALMVGQVHGCLEAIRLFQEVDDQTPVFKDLFQFSDGTPCLYFRDNPTRSNL